MQEDCCKIEGYFQIIPNYRVIYMRFVGFEVQTLIFQVFIGFPHSYLRTFIHPYSTYLEKLGLSWANKSRKSFSINKIVKFAVFQWSDVTSIHFSLDCSDIFMQRPRLFLSLNFYSPSKLFQIDVCNCKKAVIHEFIHFWFHFP